METVQKLLEKRRADIRTKMLDDLRRTRTEMFDRQAEMNKQLMCGLVNNLRPCETQISIFFKSTFKRLLGKRRTSSAPYIVGWMQERPNSAPGSTTTYLGARSKNDLSRRPVQERPISNTIFVSQIL